jgi:pimeloyl-ACP methyl ester carboxylesterase
MVLELRATVNGRTTRYLEAGSGQPLILIHAFPLGADMWRPALDRVPGGWRYIAPDLRGFGGSPLEGPAALTMDDYAADVTALMDALGIDAAVIGGLSMGGYVTFALSRRAPERVRGMVLMDTRSQADTSDGVRTRRALLELVRTRGTAAVADEVLPKLLGETTQRERPQIVSDTRRQIEANSVAGIEAAIEALIGRPDSTPDLARILRPTLVIVGGEDTITPIQDAELLHQSIAGSELRVLPRAGHLSILEAPDEWSTAVTGFLRRVF